jgi:hypothetical protein
MGKRAYGKRLNKLLNFLEGSGRGRIVNLAPRAIFGVLGRTSYAGSQERDESHHLKLPRPLNFCFPKMRALLQGKRFVWMVGGVYNGY